LDFLKEIELGEKGKKKWWRGLDSAFRKLSKEPECLKQKIINERSLDAAFSMIDSLLISLPVLKKRYDMLLEVRERKRIDILAPGTLIHCVFKPSSWGIDELKRFLETGILAPVKMGYRIGMSLFPADVSFWMTVEKEHVLTVRQENPITFVRQENPITFVLDPKWVIAHASEFRYNPDFHGHRNEPLIDLCKRLGIPPATDHDFQHDRDAWREASVEAMFVNEVQHRGDVPYEAIAGIICPYSRLLRSIIFFMSKLAEKHPEKIIPVYNANGGIIWP